MLLNVTLILFHVSLLFFYFFTNVIIYIGRKYIIFFINHCGVTTCGQTDQEPVKLSKVSKYIVHSILCSDKFRLHPTLEIYLLVLCHKSDVLLMKENMDDYKLNN